MRATNQATLNPDNFSYRHFGLVCVKVDLSMHKDARRRPCGIGLVRIRTPGQREVRIDEDSIR